MSLSKLLWENWQQWSTGGLDHGVISDGLRDNGELVLLKWIDGAFQKSGLTRPLMDEKQLVDVSTWCLHGTHSLTLLPQPIREDRVASVSRSLNISKELLLSLLGNLSLLERQVEESK